MLFDPTTRGIGVSETGVFATIPQSSRLSDQDSDWKVISVPPRLRQTLQRVMNGELRKCSPRSLRTLLQRGWVHGPFTGYQLTPLGHRIIDICEQFPVGKELNVRLSAVGAEVVR